MAAPGTRNVTKERIETIIGIETIHVTRRLKKFYILGWWENMEKICWHLKYDIPPLRWVFSDNMENA